MPIRPGSTAPYGPPAAVVGLIRGFRDRGLAVPITADVLLRAGVSESLVPRTLSSLEGLDLINDKGMPTPQFEGLRRATTDEFQPLLAETIRAAYAEVFQFVDPAKDGVERVSDAFRSFNPVGQRRRMVTLFIGLCQAAGIIPEGTARKQAAPQVKRPIARPGPVATRHVAAVQWPGEVPRSHGHGSIPPAIAGLLASLPQSGGWTEAEREKFMTTFGAVLDFVIPIRQDQGDDEADQTLRDLQQPETTQANGQR